MAISYARHRFPPSIIRHAVWLYLRFTLSYRDVEDLLAERGLDVSYETIRRSGARHAVLLLDRAAWHTTGNLVVPSNMTLIFLPSRAPELNPPELVEGARTSGSTCAPTGSRTASSDSYEAIVDAACEAWNRLVAQPRTITSIGMRAWAHIGQT